MGRRGQIITATEEMARGDYKSALTRLQFAKSLGTPRPDVDAEINLYMAECYEGLNMPAEAVGTYKYLADHYPDTVYGYMAKQNLEPDEPFILETTKAGGYLAELLHKRLLPGDFGEKNLDVKSVVFHFPLPKVVAYPFSNTFYVVNAQKTFTNYYTVGRLSKDSEWRCLRVWRTDAKGHIVGEWQVKAGSLPPSTALEPTASMNVKYLWVPDK